MSTVSLSFGQVSQLLKYVRPNTPTALESARERHNAALCLKALSAEYGLIVDIVGVGLEQKFVIGNGVFCVEESSGEDIDDLLLQHAPESGISHNASGVPNHLRSTN